MNPAENQFSTTAWSRLASALLIGGGGVCATTLAHAQSSPQPPTPRPAESAAAADDTTEIIITGFRAALDSALEVKRDQSGMVDSIMAEDIGKFPDSNLAESMQRVPGVTISRGDSGEGRSISVRGLGSQFTRVRLNGMEGASQTGSSDVYGAQNTGRGFDFNAFPSEIFSALTARKSATADVEEGSLGATVDLATPKPLDYHQSEVFTFTAKLSENDLRGSVDPRLSVLGAKTFRNGTVGVLGSLTYQERNTLEVGYAAVDILSANANGMLCSPIGYDTANPAIGSHGATETECYPGLARTSTVEAYDTIYNARRDDALDTPGSGAFLPRIPRYTNSTQNQDRLGGSLTVQFKPDDSTDMSANVIYSRLHNIRNDHYIEAISFGRSLSNNGLPMTSVRDVELNENGSLVYGLFDGVDVRSEGLVDDFVSSFKQLNLDLRHAFSDAFELTAFAGLNRSELHTRERFRYYMDAVDTSDFSIDYRDGGSTPLLGFGFDVADPDNFSFAPGLADGTVYGGIDLQGSPVMNQTDGYKGALDLAWHATDSLTTRLGAAFHRSDFTTVATAYSTADLTTPELPDGISVADLSTQITGTGKKWGHNAPDSWASLDPGKLRDALGIDDFERCGVECGASSGRVKEDASAGYLMEVFDLNDWLAVPVRGDMGMRYVHTRQYSSAYVKVSDSSSPTGVAGQFASVTRSYDNWLPSANLVVEARPDLLVRFAAAKVMARPGLGSLTPSSGINATTRSGSVQNPYLDPVEANTFDTAIEWYFEPGALLSAAFFYKDIKTYIQSVNSQVPFNQLGLPDALLDGSNTTTDEIFTVSRPFNTNGGPLKGLELNGQLPLSFLPGLWRDLGVLANYTHVTSKIDYILSSSDGVPTATTTADLTGLSKNTASGTLYYENEKFSIRSTINYRSGYIRGLPASAGSDVQGNDETIYVDASAAYHFTDNLQISLEAQNLTDERNRLYIDSVRRDTLFETRVGRTYTVGLSYRFE